MDIKTALHFFAGLNESDYKMGEPYMETRFYKKGMIVNIKDRMGSDLGYINKGLIRVYCVDPKNDKEITQYFFHENQFLFCFLMFSANEKNSYYAETLEDCEVTHIKHQDLTQLFKISHHWERFGRILAETYYRGSNDRTISFIFKSPEERYTDLMDSFPSIFQRTTLKNISSYLGVESQSLSRIRRRMVKRNKK